MVDLLATGLFRGVTTNPAILDKAGLGSIDIPDVIRWATAAGAERVFVQAWGTSADDMVELGRQFRQISGAEIAKDRALSDDEAGRADQPDIIGQSQRILDLRGDFGRAFAARADLELRVMHHGRSSAVHSPLPRPMANPQ